MTELNHDTSGELNDADLEQVAGGAQRAVKTRQPAKRSGGDLRTAKQPTRTRANSDLRTAAGSTRTRAGADRDLRSAAKPVRVSKPVKQASKNTRISKY